MYFRDTALDAGVRFKGLSPLYVCQDPHALESIRQSFALTFFDPGLDDLVATLEQFYYAASTTLVVEPDAERLSATVTRVLDGDTVRVAFPDGSDDTVRIRGLDAPETASANAVSEFMNFAGSACLDQWGLWAAEFVTGALEGRTVDLVVNSPPERSNLDLLLAYVHANGEDFGAKLLSLGFARAYTGAQHGPRLEEYLALQERATALPVGIWGC